MNGKNLRSKGFMSAVWANLECWCWCWKWISYQGFLLITHTILRRKARKRFKSCFSFNWESRKHENVRFYISCPTTSLTGRPGQARPEEEMRNECWIVGCLTGCLTGSNCRIKTLGLFRLPCTAGLSWVLYQIISKFSSYSAFQYCRCRGRERETGLPGWVEGRFLFVDHDLEIEIKSHFWSGCSWQFQRTIKYVYCRFHSNSFL